MSHQQETRQSENQMHPRMIELSKYHITGELTSADMGLPWRYIPGIVLPDLNWLYRLRHEGLQGRIIYDPQAKLTLWEEPEPRKKDRNRYYPIFDAEPLSLLKFRVEESHTGAIRGLWHHLYDKPNEWLWSNTPGKIPDDIEEMNRHMVEASFMVNNFYDQLLYNRVSLAYRMVEENTRTPLWTLAWDEFDEEVRPCLENHRFKNLTYLDRFSDTEFFNILANQAVTLQVLESGDVENAQKIMHEAPEVLIGVSAYLYSLLKMYAEGTSTMLAETFPDHETVQRILVTVAQAERNVRSTDADNPLTFNPLIKTSFSGYTNLALDAAVAIATPLAFAFGNKYTLEATGIPNTTYKNRMRATGINVFYPGSNLQKIRELHARHSDAEAQKDPNRAVDFLTVAKTIYTSLGEAMFELEHRNIEMPRLQGLLKEHGMQQMPQTTGLSQYERDFMNIESLELLLLLWQKGGSETIDKYIDDVRKEILKTADIVRGSIFAPKNDIEEIIQEAIRDPNTRLQLVVSHYDENSEIKSSTELILIKTEPERITSMKVDLKHELQELLGDSWKDANLTDMMKVYLLKYKDKFGYASVHLYSDVAVAPGHYLESAPMSTRIMENQLYLGEPELRNIVLDARAAFKVAGRSDTHAPSGERTFRE